MKNLIVLLAALIFVGCLAEKKPVEDMDIEKEYEKEVELGDNGIEDVHWVLVSMDGKELPSSVAGKVNIMLSGNDKKLNGYTGCNRLMGNYEMSDTLQISFSSVATTRMACNVADWNESDFSKMLETANNFTVSGDSLMLNVGRRAPLATFVKATKEGVVNKYWKLTKLEGKDVELVENQDREQYFILKSDGLIHGYAGCNNFSGKYELEEDNLRINFDKMQTTLRACPDVNVDESAFLQIFEQADNYTIDGNKLMLNVGRRAPLAEFEAVYF